MSATDELRRLLDELGVKWYCPIELEGSSFTRWLDRNGNRWTASGVCGVEKMRIGTRLTPEQAIAATFDFNQPIVRCRDCEFEINGYCSQPDEWHDDLWFPVEPNGFCAWGERKKVSE